MMKDLTSEMIDNIFNTAEDQIDALIALYHVIIPKEEYDQIDHLEGYPEVSHETWTYICQKFIELDRRKHPDVLAGGLWVNQGFIHNVDMPDWEINRENIRICYH